ncbi:hypothetical protein EYZ11_007636 [Aspergillus tanneri]|uniref:Uncharacterized protein n=1 Tax=Aspergillus tanneri TaxID=1220188 RepID=A0A4V3UNX4_9EURO|nr:hypothetical protein EYZ11_007636 [Aspergillus tanneri]
MSVRSQSCKPESAQSDERVWVPVRSVCALNDEPNQIRFGLVPPDPHVKAHTSKATFNRLDEIMDFCPVFFDRWITNDTRRTQSGLHYRNLHVSIGSSPTNDQKRAAKRLVTEADFTGPEPRATKWLSDFLVLTLIHESTHAIAFVGEGNALTLSTFPPCMAQIAKGTNGFDAAGNRQGGHKDAEAFAMYAMATWVNAVSWFKGYMPKDRETYKG